MSKELAIDATQSDRSAKESATKDDCKTGDSERSHRMKESQTAAKCSVVPSKFTKALRKKTQPTTANVDDSSKLKSSKTPHSELQENLQMNESKKENETSQKTQRLRDLFSSAKKLYRNLSEKKRNIKSSKRMNSKTEQFVTKGTNSNESSKSKQTTALSDSKESATSCLRTYDDGCKKVPMKSLMDTLQQSREKTSISKVSRSSRSSTSKKQKRISKRSKAKKQMEDELYYHGFRPRKDIVRLLKKPGDFLFRASDSCNRPEVVLSVLNGNRKLVNVVVRSVNKKFQLHAIRKSGRPMPRFTDIHQLIRYYKKHLLPGHALLRHGIVRPSWLIKHENVTYDQEKGFLGSGNFCKVYKGTYQRTSEEKLVVAIKICRGDKKSDKYTDETTRNARDQMVEEAQMMSYYVHEHIVEFYGLACDRTPVLIVMEYCPGGNLESHLKKQKECIEVGERVVYALEASRGMRFLHRKNCVHRDLASRNCLISAKGLIKISDFGLSKRGTELAKMDGVVEDEKSSQVPVPWMAPESLRRPMKFSSKSDVWSFAVMLYEIFNEGERPWKGDPAKKIATQIRRCQMPKFPEKVPKEISDIAARVWVLDPQARPTMKDLYLALTKVSNVYKPPPADKFALNKLEGEDTASEDEELVDVGVDDVHTTSVSQSPPQTGESTEKD